MAEKVRKTQAEKAAASAKSAKSNKKNEPSKNNLLKKSTGSKNGTKSQEIPKRLISSVICLMLFILFLVAFFLPEGYVIAFLNTLIHGMIGSVGCCICSLYMLLAGSVQYACVHFA